jgi:hypothetical protein
MNVIITAGSPTLFHHLHSRSAKSVFLKNFETMLETYNRHCQTKVLVLPLNLELGLQKDLLAVSQGWKYNFVGATQGSLATALLGLDFCNLEQSLLVGPADSYVTDGYESLLSGWHQEEFAAMTCTIDGNDDSWSYVRKSAEGVVLEVAEKRRISSLATTGLFGFRSAQIFLELATWALENRFTFEDRYYLSGTLQALLVQGGKSCALPLPSGIAYEYFGAWEERN